MNANVIFVGGTGHHVLLSWLVCQSLYDRNILKENLKLFFIDSDRGTSRVDSIYKKISAIGYNTQVEFIIKKNIPPGVEARNTLRDYLGKSKKSCDEIFFEEELLNMDVTTGFHGYPIVGATAALLEFNETNVEEFFKNKQNQLVDRIIIVGSSIGGTGSGIGPALKQYLCLFKQKKKLSTKIVLITYIGYLKTVKRKYGVDIGYSINELGIGGWDNGDSCNGEHGNYKSNSDAAMAYYSKRLFYNDLDEVAFIGTPKDIIEFRTDDGVKNQNDRCTVIHLIMSNLIDYYLDRSDIGNDERKCKIFQVNNRYRGYVLNMRTDIQCFAYPEIKYLDYFILTKIAQCLELVFFINRKSSEIVDKGLEENLINNAQSVLMNYLNILRELDEMFRRSEKTISKEENSKELLISSCLFNIFDSKFYELDLWGQFLSAQKRKSGKFSNFLEFYIANMTFVQEDYISCLKKNEQELGITLKKNKCMKEIIGKNKLGQYDKQRVKNLILDMDKIF